MRPAIESGPRVHDDRIVFRYEDRRADVVSVRLYQELERPRLGPRFERSHDGSWILEWERPDVDRIEYLVEISRRDGSSDLVCDPGNDLRADGAFGPKSVLEMPGYAAPEWTRAAAEGSPAPRARSLSLGARMDGRVRASLWTSSGVGARDPLPLLVVHDGLDYARFAGLLRMLDTYTKSSRLPPMRAALLRPVERDDQYSASAHYARLLAADLLPQLARIAPLPEGRAARVGLGASLGALALLHAHRKNPAAFGGLVLQSGSFFQRGLDSQEAGFIRFVRVTRFIAQLLTSTAWQFPIPISMSCGSIEENVHNNRSMRGALARQGYDVSLHETRDGHNWVAWRDALDPVLVRLLNELWR